MGTSAKIVAARVLALFIVVWVGLACSSRSPLNQDAGDFSAGQNVSSGGAAAVSQTTGGTRPATGGTSAVHTGGTAPATGGTPAATGGVAVVQPSGGTSPATGGAAPATGGTDGGAALDPIQQELMTRWNEAAATVPTTNSFQWVADQFPHPTFKMGTPQAYGEFAEVLLAFFRAGNNFDFLAQHQLFRFPLTYILLSGQETWTFEELANDFGAGSFGIYSEATRAGIAEYAARIQAILSPADAAPPDA